MLITILRVTGPADTTADVLTGPTSALSAVAVFVVVPATATALYVQVKPSPMPSVVGIVQPTAARSVRSSTRVTPVKGMFPMLTTTIRKYTVAPTATVTLDRYAPESGVVRTPLAIAISPPDVAVTTADALSGPASLLSAVAVFVVVPSAAIAL